MAETFNRTFLQATALVHLGGVHVIKGDLVVGLPLLERALELCRNTELPMAFVFLTVRLGQGYKLAGRVEEAIALLEQGREMAASSSSRMVHPLILAHLADAYTEAGNNERAVEVAQHAVALAREVKARGTEAWALYFLGRAMQSRERYLESMELAAALGMRLLSAHCHCALGELARRAGKGKDAEEQIGTAARLFREMKMQLWLEQAESALMKD
jgi:tetratricopeptide (TPR) repeat protein